MLRTSLWTKVYTTHATTQPLGLHTCPRWLWLIGPAGLAKLTPLTWPGGLPIWPWLWLEPEGAFVIGCFPFLYWLFCCCCCVWVCVITGRVWPWKGACPWSMFLGLFWEDQFCCGRGRAGPGQYGGFWMLLLGDQFCCIWWFHGLAWPCRLGGWRVPFAWWWWFWTFVVLTRDCEMCGAVRTPMMEFLLESVASLRDVISNTCAILSKFLRLTLLAAFSGCSKGSSTKREYVLGNHLVLLLMFSHLPVNGQTPSSVAFKFMSENFAKKETRSSERELLLTDLDEPDLNLAMLAAESCAMLSSAVFLTPFRSSTALLGYISPRGGKIAGTHVWRWKMTNKLREYELKVPFFGLLISWALAHSFTSKTKSRNLPSISLIQNKNLLFNSPSRLSIEMSHEILWWPLTTFRMGTRAWITNCSLYHRPEALIARSNCASKVCFCFFPVNKIDEPLNKSTEMSKSPHRVKRFETKDPNGWTVAPLKLSTDCKTLRSWSRTLILVSQSARVGLTTWRISWRVGSKTGFLFIVVVLWNLWKELTKPRNRNPI